MGYEIDWSALDFVVEYLQIDDVELLMDGLLLLREIKREKANAQ